ncbi:MAG: hypothetical protein KGI56_00690 [Acidobacteriota bacterium]|nr:hypothetical protein [Acidobacteriota bacterium]
MRTSLPTPLSLSDRSRHPGSSRAFEPALLASALLLLAIGCNRDQVAHYRVPKSSEPEATASMPPMGMPGMPEAGTDAAQPARAGLKWTLPKGWSQEPGSGMRFATLKPPVAGKLDVSVIVLPGPAGGELANVNRWRGQMGLPPLDASAEAAQRTIVKTKAGDLAVFDFTGQAPDKGRMVAGLITTSDGNTWFLKMAGDPGPVEQAKPEFMRLMGSIHLD